MRCTKLVLIARSAGHREIILHLRNWWTGDAPTGRQLKRDTYLVRGWTNREPWVFATFDLTLVRRGQWSLYGHHVSMEHLERQRKGMDYAAGYARQCQGIIVRLHNHWKGREPK